MHNKKNILKTLKCKKNGNIRLWHKDNCSFLFEGMNFFYYLENSGNPEKLNVDIMKFGKRRSTFLIKESRKDLIIKSFPLNKYHDKLRYKNYGLSEFLNNRMAKKKGIPSPDYYGYFEIKSKGLVDNCGVVMEYLNGFTQLAMLYQKEKETLFLAIPILVDLYRVGINHIDISLNNIFFNCKEQKYVIIDWQYCNLCAPYNDLLLMIQAAYLLKYTKVDEKRDLWSSWLKQLYEKSSPKIKFDSFMKNVRSLQKHPLSIKDRLSLDIRRFKISL